MTLQIFFDNFKLLADAPNGSSKLRELILQLAIEGKLVAQDPIDESAALLLQRIKASQEKLAKTRLTKQETVRSIRAEEKPFTLPDNWVWVRLSQITNAVHYGYTASANHALSEVRLLRITDIQNGKVDWSTVPGCEIEKKKLEGVKLANNDILIARTGGTIGKSFIVQNLPVTAVFASYLIRAVPNENINARYLKLFLESRFYWSQLYEKSMGTGQPNVNATSLKSLVVPLPPFKEQECIVTKVDELREHCDDLDALQHAGCESRVRLNTVTLAPLNKAAWLAPKAFEQAYARLTDNFEVLYDSTEAVAKLRSTILQLAVQGKLVQQDPQDEPAAILLEGIKRDKTRLIKEKKIKPDKSVPPITADEKLFTLPRGWEWSKLDSLCFLVTDGTHYTPTYISSGVPFLSVKDITHGKIDFTNTRFISHEEHEGLSQRCKPEFEDILFTKVGTTGIAKVIDVETEFSIFVSLALLKFSKVYLSPYFLELLLNSPMVRDQSRRDTQGVGNKNLVLKYIKNFVVPIPPLREQKRIVAKVNHLMTLCDELESKLRKAEADSEKLMNAAVQYVLSSTVETRPHNKLSVRP